MANQTPPTILGSIPANMFQPDSFRNIRIAASTAAIIVGTYRTFGVQPKMTSQSSMSGSFCSVRCMSIRVRRVLRRRNQIPTAAAATPSTMYMAIISFEVHIRLSSLIKRSH